jgi:hypothetical protein
MDPAPDPESKKKIKEKRNKSPIIHLKTEGTII